MFGHHKKVLDGLQAKLGKTHQAVRIDGSTSMEARKQAMDSFQQREHVRLAILSITAAGVCVCSLCMLLYMCLSLVPLSPFVALPFVALCLPFVCLCLLCLCLPLW